MPEREIDPAIKKLIGDEEKKIKDFKIVFFFGAGAVTGKRANNLKRFYKPLEELIKKNGNIKKTEEFHHEKASHRDTDIQKDQRRRVCICG